MYRGCIAEAIANRKSKLQTWEPQENRRFEICPSPVPKSPQAGEKVTEGISILRLATV